MKVNSWGGGCVSLSHPLFAAAPPTCQPWGCRKQGCEVCVRRGAERREREEARQRKRKCARGEERPKRRPRDLGRQRNRDGGLHTRDTHGERGWRNLGARQKHTTESGRKGSEGAKYGQRCSPHGPRGAGDPGGPGLAGAREQDGTLGYSNPTPRAEGRSMGVPLAGGRALGLRVISPPRFPPECGGGAVLRSCRSAAEPALSSRLVRASVQRADIDPSQPSSIPAACSPLCGGPTKEEGLALQDASAEILCQKEPQRARGRAEHWLLQVPPQPH